MEIENDNKHSVRFAVTVIVLVVVMSGLAWAMMFSTARADSVADQARKGYYARMSLISLAMMLMTLVVLLWVLARRFTRHLREHRRREPTPYVDAWAEAGRRLKLDEPADPAKDNEDDDLPPHTKN